MSSDQELRDLMMQWNCSALTDILLEHGFTVSNLDSINNTALFLLFAHEKSFLGPLLQFQKSLEESKSKTLEPVNKKRKMEVDFKEVEKESGEAPTTIYEPNHTSNPVRPAESKQHIHLTEVLCSTNSTKNYYDENGYLYTKRTERADVIYFRCKNSQGEMCNANVICKSKNLNDCILSIAHSHGPQQINLDNLKFMKTMEMIIMKDPYKKALEVYNEAKDEIRNSTNMLHIGEISQYTVFIHRNKKTHIPLLPKTLEEFESYINHSKYRNYYTLDKNRKLFFHGVLRGSSGGGCVIFVSDEVLTEIKKRKFITLLMDGTFKCLPKHLKFRQLYVINAIIKGRCFPLMYVLMEKKDTVSYRVLFGKLKELIPNVNVENFMTDYEAATRKAIREIFPDARLSGCFFHYVQAIVKRFRRYKLDDEKFSLAREKVCALALLPNEHILDAFEIISKRFANSQRWTRFKQYWLKYWAGANISVYGLLHRTNNFSESHNHVLNSMLKSRHPDVWTLIHYLKTIESMRSDELRRVSAGSMTPRRPKSSKIRKTNEKIRRAIMRFDKTKNVKQFLKQVTFQESYYHDGLYDSDEDDDDDDDEIIPNNWDKNCNFGSRPKIKKSASKRKQARPVLKTQRITRKTSRNVIRKTVRKQSVKK